MFSKIDTKYYKGALYISIVMIIAETTRCKVLKSNENFHSALVSLRL